ncbi:MAG TPA: ACP phosphodiesterase [Puia sp.]|nr:ACP phosphodiesterase [Puia sp.]
MPPGFDKLQQVNYLAHAYLSFDIPDIVTGNLISDFVKGKRKLDYPPAIQAGITLHRAIDTFTDGHPAIHRAKSCFRADYGLYSAPLTDVALDHFLAGDPLIFPSPADLAAFARHTYEQLTTRANLFPERFNRLFPYMRDQDWFSGYRTKQGIFASFGGLARRAAYMPDPEQACRLFELHYTTLGDCYRLFFPELKDFALKTLQEVQ